MIRGARSPATSDGAPPLLNNPCKILRPRSRDMQIGKNWEGRRVGEVRKVKKYKSERRRKKPAHRSGTRSGKPVWEKLQAGCEKGLDDRGNCRTLEVGPWQGLSRVNQFAI